MTELKPGQRFRYTFPRTGHVFTGELLNKRGGVWQVVWDDLGKGVAPIEAWIEPQRMKRGSK